MAQFDDHIVQVGRNLKFLQSINKNCADSCDWQVTVCFYTSLHLVNAHLSKYNLQYRKHNDVNYAINFANPLSPARLPEDVYLSYTSLQSLSRRSRYLVNEKDGKIGNSGAFLTYEKHVAKAIKHLDCLLNHFKALYKLELPVIEIKCAELHPKASVAHLKVTA